MNKLFEEASYVIDQIESRGYKAYFVGGCVRDYCLGRPIKDIDIASSAKPEEIQAIFPKTIPVGIEHGTVIVRHNHVSYEVTTFRKEGEYEDYRRPSKVWFVTDLEEDLSRRDFTFNAMAMDKDFQVIDPFEGREDLRNMQIRTVGEPDHRLSEDPLRIMRAFRFMSAYDMHIEERTTLALKKNAPLLKRISTERITVEFKKLLEGERAGKALQLMKVCCVFLYLPYPIEEISEGSMLSFDWSSLETEEQRWAAVTVLSKVDDERDFLKKWKLPNKVIQSVLAIIFSYKKDQWTKIDLYNMGLTTALSGLKLRCLIKNDPYEEQAKELTRLAEEINIHSRDDIPLNGEDIVRIKQKTPGVWLGQLFNDLEKEIVEGKLSLSKREIRDWVRRWGKE
ncbi:CCA tRNA nucleotidyltransferase [Fictibacillus phosphorivorans]|uniref:CCA tRNA nucleotidyltransferase n=1 Tax=Fictibacillus phosphorivorans TaxID=1221500 RepID=UPI00203CB58B|nr:CCA tRNA nucleotidyltransferase [Fictibacillus phosphorivorans]MCM3718907.1 CCA tRNA nucleotidyltransferase [Fictibacillus phosphorivorans]MCM3776529.1 CCA tRNA nucleotidyltransferase [Fictibacillus phosphorivorans]